MKINLKDSKHVNISNKNSGSHKIFLLNFIYCYKNNCRVFPNVNILPVILVHDYFRELVSPNSAQIAC